jgi:hypothetical protein
MVAPTMRNINESLIAATFVALLLTVMHCQGERDTGSILTMSQRDVVKSLTVYDSHADPLWRIHSANPHIIDSVQYGVVPPGFVQDYPLRNGPRPFVKGENLSIETLTRDYIFLHKGVAVGPLQFVGGSYRTAPLSNRLDLGMTTADAEAVMGGSAERCSERADSPRLCINAARRQLGTQAIDTLVQYSDTIWLYSADEKCTPRHTSSEVGLSRGRVLWIVRVCGEPDTVYDLRMLDGSIPLAVLETHGIPLTVPGLSKSDRDIRP